MSTQFKRIAASATLAVCLLLTLVAGSFLVSAKGPHGVSLARGATPAGISCGGSVGTPC